MSTTKSRKIESFNTKALRTGGKCQKLGSYAESIDITGKNFSGEWKNPAMWVNILHAENGYKAIDYVHFNPQIDLVLMGGSLPYFSSIETTREILNINPLLQVIAQTTMDMESYFFAGCVD